MQTKEIKKIMNEVLDERKIKRKRRLENGLAILRMFLLPLIYYSWFILRDTLNQNKLFIWAVGAYTIIALFGFFDFLKRRKEVN